MNKVSHQSPIRKVCQAVVESQKCEKGFYRENHSSARLECAMVVPKPGPNLGDRAHGL